MLVIMSVTSFAVENEVVDIFAIAQNIIHTELTIDEVGNVIKSYTNLDEFIDAVHDEYAEISDYDIAISLLQYTEQEYRGLPESEILNYLTLDNLTTSTSYVTLNEAGEAIVSNDATMPADIWTSEDGYMKITTTYSYLKSVGNEKYYQVTGMATWLKYPAVAIEDAFVIGTTGTFDDSYSEYASVSQTFKCSNACDGLYTYKVRGVSNIDTVDGDLSMTYNNYVPEIHFTPLSPSCEHCGGGAKDDYFMAYMRYGVITDESINIQAGYGHKTFGLDNISVGIDNNGTPSFSGSLITISKYIARPVTIAY